MEELKEKIKTIVATSEEQSHKDDLFSDIKYICSSSPLITSSLEKGFNVAQLPNGDVIVTEVKKINVHYSWDRNKQKMVKISQS